MTKTDQEISVTFFTSKNKTKTKIEALLKHLKCGWMESHTKMGKNNTQRPKKGLKEAKKTLFHGTCQADTERFN